MTSLAVKKRVAAGVLAAVIGLAGGVAAFYEGNPPESYMDRLARVPTPTACRGHTGTNVRVGMKYSPAKCAKWFDEDLRRANALVHQCTSRRLPLNIEAALTDFVYNVGGGKAGVKDGFCVLKNGRQSTIRRLANAGDWAGVCGQFKYWTSAGGVKLQGLVNRREEDQALCEAAP